MQHLVRIAVLLTIMTSGAAMQPPTAVLQAGLGDGHESWSAVSVAIAAEVRVFAYDRPGYGGRVPAEGELRRVGGSGVIARASASKD